MSINAIQYFRKFSSTVYTSAKALQDQKPDFRHFLETASSSSANHVVINNHGPINVNKAARTGIVKRTEILCNCNDPVKLSACTKSTRCQYRVDQVPVYIKTYGCQMNENDTSIVSAILKDYGYRLIDDERVAEIQLLMTCAIRESAESKIWSKLRTLKRLKEDPSNPLKQVGLLGCMAERLKTKIIETDNSVDIIAGPDAYRDLPRLFSINRMSNDKAVNCLLSFDETYCDIRQVTKLNEVTSFLSITRGCDNLCSYCIVPFTRGRERSRPLPTILEEVRNLIKSGVKEVTLLGQNVNSYRDVSTNPESIGRLDLLKTFKGKETLAEGFGTVYKPRTRGITFDVLLEEVARISPELRIRFTSPHPKDFTDDVIEVIKKYKNIARNVHLPAQSGSDTILDRMRRGYTKTAYLELVRKLRSAIPDLSITSDFIAGFCGETDQDHEETIDLIKRVGYSFIYVFPYSDRDKTSAHHNLKDDVLPEVKVKRVNEIGSLFRILATDINRSLIGSTQLVLIESKSFRSDADWQGRSSNNVKTIIAHTNCLDSEIGQMRPIRRGDYVLCQVIDANSQTLKAKPLYITSQEDYNSTQ